MFNFSSYIKDSEHYNGPNNLFIGKMKDKTSDVLRKGFVRLKSKTYAFITEDNYKSKKQNVLTKMLLMMN